MTRRTADPFEVGLTVSLRAIFWQGSLPVPGDYIATAFGVWA